MKSKIATFPFVMTREQKEAINNIIKNNVKHIKNFENIAIHKRYKIEKIILEGVSRGRDLHYITTKLQIIGILKKEADNIALNQVNRAFAKLDQIKCLTAGMTEAVWMHSGGYDPYPEHLAANGKKYKIAEGLPIGENGEYVLPGEQNHCTCTPFYLSRFSLYANKTNRSSNKK